MSRHAVLACLALTILTCLPLLCAQETKDEPTVDGHDLSKGPGGRYIAPGDPNSGPYTGWVVYTRGSGATQIVIQKLHVVDGLKHGMDTFWHVKSDGTRGGIMRESPYERGKRHGTEKSYHENGQISAIHTYKDDVEDGPYETYFDTGKLQSQTSMKSGKKDGVSKYWRPNGNLSLESTYRSDCRHGPEKSYYENGKLEREDNYLAEERKDEKGTSRWVAVKDGVCKKYMETGVLVTATTFVRDVLRREKKYDSSSGILSDERLIKDDGWEIGRRYWPNGRVRDETSKSEWQGGSRGTTKTYYESGQLESLVTYRVVKGQWGAHGPFAYYKKNGTISSQGYNRDNQVVETPVEGPPDPAWEDDLAVAKEPAKAPPPVAAQPPEEPATAKTPKDAEIESLLAESNQALTAKDYAKIMVLTGKLLKLDPRNKWAWVRRGIALANLDLPEEALKAYRTCVEFAPDFPNGHYQLALGLNNQGDFPAAISAMTRAAELFADPTDVADSHYMVAVFWLRKGDVDRIDRAIPGLEAAIRSDPKHSRSLALLGACYLDRKRYDDVIAVAKRSIALDPAQIPPHSMLAGAYVMTDQPDLALSEYKKAFDLDPSDPDPAKMVAMICREKGELKEAAEWYRKYLKLKPDDKEVQDVYDGILKQLGEDGGSRAPGGAEVVEAGTPGASEVESLAGVSLDELLKKEKDLMPLLAGDSGMAARRQLAAVRTAMADRYLAEKKVDSAVACLANACLLDNTNAARWEKLGDWLMFQPGPGTSDLEQHAYESALLLSPKNREARIKLASSYVADRCYSDAIPHLEKVIYGGENAPEPGWSYIGMLTCCYAATGDLDRGRDFLRECAGESGDNRFLIAYALLERSAGRTDEATALLESVESSEKPGSPLALYARHILTATQAPGRQDGGK